MLKRVGSGRNGRKRGYYNLVPRTLPIKMANIFYLNKRSKADFTVSRTSLIRTPKVESKVSVLERCPYKRGHYDDVTFMTPLAVLSV